MRGLHSEISTGNQVTMEDEIVDELALKLDLANMELRHVDEVLSRRPALAMFTDRYTKLEFLCMANGELLKLAHGYERYLMAHEMEDAVAAEALIIVRRQIKKYGGG